MINVLHISDLHFSTDPTIHPFRIADAKKANVRDRESLAEAIADSLQISRMPRISGIIVSGDLRWSTCKEGFALAAKAIIQLAEKLGVAREKIVVIPGNHDADWAQSPEQRFADYLKTEKKITKCKAGKDHQSVTVLSDDQTAVVVYGVNSAAIESKEDAGIGMVGPTSLQTLFRRALPPETKDKKVIKLLCLHHHTLPVSYVASDYFSGEKKRTSVTLDAKAVLNLCAEHDVAMMLHGHQHQPCLASFTCISPLTQDMSQAYSVWVSGVGSAGLDRAYLGDAGRRHFQVLQMGFEGSIPKALINSFASDADNSLKFSPITPVSFQLSQRLRGSTLIEFDHCRNAKTSCLNISQAFPEGRLPSDADDRSNLFFVLLKCRHCKKTNMRLRAIAQTNGIEGIYDLYGDYDLLVKIRSSSQRAVEHSILRPLLAEGLINATYDKTKRRFDNVKVIDVCNELLPETNFRREIDIVKGIKVFILFYDVDRAEALQSHCEDALKRVWADGWSGRVAVTGLFFSDFHAIAEVYVSCGSYAALNLVTQKLEEHLESRGNSMRKITMLGQSIWESQ